MRDVRRDERDGRRMRRNDDSCRGIHIMFLVDNTRREHVVLGRWSESPKKWNGYVNFKSIEDQRPRTTCSQRVLSTSNII